MAKVSWKPKYNIDIKNLSHTDVFHLRDALAEKAAKLLNQTPNIFSQIIAVCDHILEFDEQD